MKREKIVNLIKRNSTLRTAELADMDEYDRIYNLEWDGIPGLKDKEYYVPYITTAGADMINQAASVYAIQRPKWDVLPRGRGDIELAEKMERILEWYFWRAAQMSLKPYHHEAMIHIGKYNKVCGQLQWIDDYGFCVKNFHPKTLRYEAGSKLQWVAVVDNVPATSIIELWSDYAKPGWFEKLVKGDEIGSALKKIQRLVEDDEEQRMMYVDFTNEEHRLTYCYPVSTNSIDDNLGYPDDLPSEDLIVIQDKENTLGFINWVIAEGEGEPLLFPLLKGKYYDNINDLGTVKATSLFRRGIYPLFLQHGSSTETAHVDYSGDQDVLKAPTGSQVTPLIPPPLDPGYDLLEAQMEAKMRSALGITNITQAQVSNVQHATYDAQVKMWLLRFEPNKRTAEKYYEKLGYLMFRWAKKKNLPLLGTRMKSRKVGGQLMMRGDELMVLPDDVDLDRLYIKCTILENSPTDVLQLANQISMFKQAGIRIPDDEYIERLDMGDPAILSERYEEQEIRNAELANAVKQIAQEADMKFAEFQAQLQAAVQAQIQAQMPPAPPGSAPIAQQQPLPSDEAMSGQGFNAAMGGLSPQAANPEITQEMR